MLNFGYAAFHARHPFGYPAHRQQFGDPWFNAYRPTAAVFNWPTVEAISCYSAIGQSVACEET